MFDDKRTHWCFNKICFLRFGWRLVIDFLGGGRLQYAGLIGATARDIWMFSFRIRGCVLHVENNSYVNTNWPTSRCHSFSFWILPYALLEENVIRKYSIDVFGFAIPKFAFPCCFPYFLYYSFFIYSSVPLAGLWLQHAELFQSNELVKSSWSTSFRVIACCLTAPSHYLNQCWIINSVVQ